MGADRVKGDLVDLDRARALARLEHARGLEDAARVDLVAREQIAVGARDPLVGARLRKPAQRTRVVGDFLGEPFDQLHRRAPRSVDRSGADHSDSERGIAPVARVIARSSARQKPAASSARSSQPPVTQ